MLKDEGMAELLPACNAVIFDEAHQLPETASLFFGDSVSTAQVTDLARDTKVEALASARDCLDLPPACASLEKAAKDLRLTLSVDPARYTLGATGGPAGLRQPAGRADQLPRTFCGRRRDAGGAFGRAGELLAAQPRTARRLSPLARRR